MHTASHWAAPYIVRHGSYSASLRTMSTFHFFSIGPCLPSAPSMSFNSLATPKTLHEGYSLHASENVGGAASAIVVVVKASAKAAREMSLGKRVCMISSLVQKVVVIDRSKRAGLCLTPVGVGHHYNFRR